MLDTPPAVDRGTPDIVEIAEPEGTRTIGGHAGDVIREMGLVHLPWHELVLRHAMAKHDSDRWVYSEVALVLPWRDDRETGQSIAFQRALIGAVLLGERVLYVTENDHDQLVMFNAFVEVLASMPVLDKLVTKIRRANGEQGVTFHGDGSVNFRTSRRCRGISADLLIADNADLLGNRFEDEVFPVLATRPNAQVWWISTTSGRWRQQALRNRAMLAVDRPVMYLEWQR